MSLFSASQRLFIQSALVMILCGVASVCPAAPHKSGAAKNSWNWALPQTISDANTTVTFDLDSTWHDLHGTSSKISGRAWLEDQTNPLSVKATLNFPVMQLTTGGEMRDERMLEVMDSEHHKYVTLAVDGLTPKCDARLFAEGERCPVELPARLTIRGNERDILLPGVISREAGAIKLSGEVSFSWLDFGVEDPSILIAKLQPQMSVRYTIVIPTVEIAER
jgi:hypothetical protein